MDGREYPDVCRFASEHDSSLVCVNQVSFDHFRHDHLPCLGVLPGSASFEVIDDTLAQPKSEKPVHAVGYSVLSHAQLDDLEHNECYKVAAVIALLPEFLWRAKAPMTGSTQAIRDVMPDHPPFDSEFREVDIVERLGSSFGARGFLAAYRAKL